MGQSVRCLASFEGQSAEGTAELETDELRFRGAFRLKVPLREVRTAVALDGRLEVTFGAGTAVFDLGPKAAAWADRILHPPSLLDKLGVRAGQRVGLVESGGQGLPAGPGRGGGRLRRERPVRGRAAGGGRPARPPLLRRGGGSPRWTRSPG